MKKSLIYIPFLVALISVCVTSCSNDDDLSSTSVVRATATEENDFDRWLTRNYVEPYNI